MIDHHLIELLTTFSRKEMTRFMTFSLSPYHHKHEETRQLIAYLSDCFPVFNEDNCERQQIWKVLFGKKKFNQSKLSVLFTYAWRLAEEFLVQEQLQKTPLSKTLLLAALRERGQKQLFERQLKKTKQQLEDFQLRDAHYYQQVITMAGEAIEFYGVWEPRRENESLIEKEHALDQYYLLEKLRDAVSLQVRSQILKGDYSARLLEGVLEELRQNLDAYRNAPAIQVYFHLYQMMDAASLDGYRKTLGIFQENEQLLQRREVMHIYIYLQNFCIAQINRNQQPFLRELFGLYQAQLSRELLHEDGYLIEWHYKNIVTTALRLGELEWVNTFIEEQKSELSPETAENAYRFNKAAYCHAVGEYGKVLELLTQVEYRNIRYSLGAKALLLRTYYELEEFEALHALVESFRQYLQRNRLLADFRRGGYYHLFRLTRRLAKLRTQMPYLPEEQIVQRLTKVRMDVEATSPIFNRVWLEQKMAELEGQLALQDSSG